MNEFMDIVLTEDGIGTKRVFILPNLRTSAPATSLRKKSRTARNIIRS